MRDLKTLDEIGDAETYAEGGLARNFEIRAPGAVVRCSNIASGAYSTLEEAQAALQHPSIPHGMQVVEVDRFGRAIRYFDAKPAPRVHREEECAADGPHEFHLYTSGGTMAGSHNRYKTAEEAVAANAAKHNGGLYLVEVDSLGRPVKHFSKEEARQFIVTPETPLVEKLIRRIEVLEKIAR